MDIKLNHWVKIAGKRYAPGSVLTEMNEDIIKSLVKDGAALHYHEETTEEIIPKRVIIDTAVPPEDPNSIKEELDENFTLDELKEDAQRFGIEFASAVTKKDLIAKIIKLEKAELFINLLEDSE